MACTHFGESLSASEAGLVFRVYLFLIYRLITGYVEKYEDVCVPIVARCGSLRSLTYFYLNDELTNWPRNPLHTHNISYNEANSTYVFCFNNITEKLRLLEFCYKSSDSCTWCSENIGYKIKLLSRSTIIPTPTEQGIYMHVTNSNVYGY